MRYLSRQQETMTKPLPEKNRDYGVTPLAAFMLLEEIIGHSKEINDKAKSNEDDTE